MNRMQNPPHPGLFINAALRLLGHATFYSSAN
jgi:hypothetical protein